MITVVKKAVLPRDAQAVWNVVTGLEDWSWRSDLSRIEVVDERRFVEYTKAGYATSFSVTLREPCRRWGFTMENTNMAGEWTGVFTPLDGGTEVVFTESIRVKKRWMRPFARAFLKKQQRRYLADLNRALGAAA